MCGYEPGGRRFDSVRARQNYSIITSGCEVQATACYFLTFSFVPDSCYPEAASLVCASTAFVVQSKACDFRAGWIRLATIRVRNQIVYHGGSGWKAAHGKDIRAYKCDAILPVLYPITRAEHACFSDQIQGLVFPEGSGSHDADMFHILDPMDSAPFPYLLKEIYRQISFKNTRHYGNSPQKGERLREQL